MQGVNDKKTVGSYRWELQIAQCKHPKGGVDVIISKFNTPKNIKYYQMHT